MPSANVRTSVQSYFQSVPGLATLYRSEPWFTPGEAWTINGVTGTVAFVHLGKQSEDRIDMGGHKDANHIVTIVVLYQYRIPANSKAPDGWSDDLDTLLDAIAAKLRADPTLGDANLGPVWQAGQDNHDVVIERDMPIRQSGKIWCLAYVQFMVHEIVVA